MIRVRLLADDLTGALDTAAEFVPLAGAMPVRWQGDWPVDGSAAMDSTTRERDPETAMKAVRRLAPGLKGADIAFKKIDSLLRGRTIAEIASCMHAGIWQYCALAPAFPYQGRITEAGRQYRRDGEDWVPIGGDMVAGLRLLGVQARPSEPGSRLRPGVTVFDAARDEDLRQIVATVRRCAEPVLWAGAGGLAQAMCEEQPQGLVPPLPRPILGVFGSDQAATADQLAACAPHWVEVEGLAFDPVSGRLTETGVALVSFRLRADTGRATAAEAIAAGIKGLIDRVDPPGTVVVAGGETLRSLCDATDARDLLVRGRLVPGVPVSVMQGGRWNGVTVVSKSGAFGHPQLLRDLILERTV